MHRQNVSVETADLLRCTEMLTALSTSELSAFPLIPISHSWIKLIKDLHSSNAGFYTPEVKAWTPAQLLVIGFGNWDLSLSFMHEWRGALPFAARFLNDTFSGAPLVIYRTPQFTGVDKVDFQICDFI